MNDIMFCQILVLVHTIKLLWFAVYQFLSRQLIAKRYKIILCTLRNFLMGNNIFNRSRNITDDEQEKKANEKCLSLFVENFLTSNTSRLKIIAYSQVN